MTSHHIIKELNKQLRKHPNKYSMNHEQTNYEEDQIELLHFHAEEEIILWSKITKGEKENGKRI